MSKLPHRLHWLSSVYQTLASAMRLLIVLISLAALTACKEQNPRYCGLPANAEMPECGGGDGSSGPCRTNGDCIDTPATPVCDTSKPGDAVCVQCTAGQAEQCTGLFPRCDLTTETCAACNNDEDCGGAAGVCLPDGSCADPANVIHAIATGGSTDTEACGGTGAGNACDLQTALAKARMESGIQDSKKNVIKLDDPAPAMYKAGLGNFILDVDTGFGLIIDARGALIERNSDGSILTINTGKGVTLLGGTIEGAHGGDAIHCNTGGTLTLQGTTLRMSDESGIDASGCTLTLTDSTITDNNKAGTLVSGIVITDGSLTISRSIISSNRGGGILINNAGKFAVVGNVFLGNGDPGGIVGGFSAATTAAGNQIDFNTFAENETGGSGAGISCTVTGLVAQNNIAWNNNGLSGKQVDGTCQHAFSDIGPMSIIGMQPFDGGNNISADPLFMVPTSDLRLRGATPVRGKANPAVNLTGFAETDIAHAKRVSPADLGAYVAPPP